MLTEGSNGVNRAKGAKGANQTKGQRDQRETTFGHVAPLTKASLEHAQGLV